MTRFDSWLVFFLIVVAKVDSNVDWYRVLREDLETSPKCVYNPCRNGGSCTAYQDRFHCSCKKGWIGNNCERHSSCLPNPCVHGDCSANLESYTCTCKPGYKGKNCDNVQRCHPNPCLNGGSCTEAGYNVYCECQPGFKGKLCEYEAKCQPINPCMNGGSCQEWHDKYHCICEALYMGYNCELIRPPPTKPAPTISLRLEGPQAIPSPNEQGDSAVSKLTLSRFTETHRTNELTQPIRNSLLDSESFSKSVFSPSKYDPPPFGGIVPRPDTNVIHRVYSPEDLPQFIQDEIKSEKHDARNKTSLPDKEETKSESNSPNSKNKSDNKGLDDEVKFLEKNSNDNKNKLEKSSLNNDDNSREKDKEILSKTTETKKNDSMDKININSNSSDKNPTDDAMKLDHSKPSDTLPDTKSEISISNTNMMNNMMIMDADATKRSGLLTHKVDTRRTNKSSTNVFFKNTTYNYILDQSNYDVKTNDINSRKYKIHKTKSHVNILKNENARKRSEKYIHINKPRLRKKPVDFVNGQIRSGVTLLLSRGKVTTANTLPKLITRNINIMNMSLDQSERNQKIKSDIVRGENLTLLNKSTIDTNITETRDNDTFAKIISKYSDKVKLLTNIINTYSDKMKHKNLIHQKVEETNISNVYNKTMGNYTSKKHNLLYLPPKLPYITHQASSLLNFMYNLPSQGRYMTLHTTKEHSFPYPSQNVPYTTYASKKHNFFYSPHHNMPYVNIKRVPLLPYVFRKHGTEGMTMNYHNTSRSIPERNTLTNKNNACPVFCKSFCDPWCAKIGCCVVTRDQLQLIRSIEQKNAPVNPIIPGNNCPKCHEAA